MTLNTIKNTLYTDKACREYLASIRWQHGYICPVCQCREAWVTSEIKYKCKNCGHKQSVTSGTLLQDSHIPLNKWLLAIWIFSSYGKPITAKALSNELSFGNLKSAQHILKILHSVNRASKPAKLKNTVEVVQDTINYKGKRHSVIIATEIFNRSVLQIRIQEIEYNNKSQILEFIRVNVQPSHSSVSELSADQNVTMSGIITELLTQEELGDTFNKIIKRTTYQYRYSNMMLSKFRGWISNQRTTDAFAQMCLQFCALHNRKTCADSFEELLDALLTVY